MSGIVAFLTDRYQWYAFPTIWGFNQITDQLEEEQFLEKYNDKKLVLEREIYELSEEKTPELRKWIEFCHRLCAEKGSEIFSASGGWLGFEAAEPVMSICYANRIMLIISMRYRSIDRKGTGQMISAYEFLEDTAQITNAYQIYSTGPRIGNLIKSMGQVAEIAGPIFRALN